MNSYTVINKISFLLTSRDNFLKNGALIWVIAWPVAVDPVNEISGTSGCWTIAEPALGPLPKTKLHTPGGSPIDRDKECMTLLACMIQIKLWLRQFQTSFTVNISRGTGNKIFKTLFPVFQLLAWFVTREHSFVRGGVGRRNSGEG